ncbi:MAG: glutamate--cysteine ligase [Planctomycetota bacterium]
MQYHFNASPTHSLGVEVELQLVDPKSFALTNRITDVMNEVPDDIRACVKPEFMQSYCEICTDVCKSVREVEEDLTRKMAWAHEAGEKLGLQFIWGGTHPFSRWDDQSISPGERYAWLMDTMQDVARRLVVFGLHVHVGVDSGDKAIQMCDRMLRHLPTLLALSANSPFWCGRDTGMLSYRTKIMEALPTAGLPYTLRNWSEYVWLINNLKATGFIRSIKEIWWDVRPHHDFGTVEIRVMDQPLNMRHLLGLVALTQSLVAGISSEIDRGAYLFDCHPMVAKQNKWHAARYGMEATFIDPDTMLAVPAKQVAKRLIERCIPYAERLGCAEQLGYLDDILENGTGARRQRRIYQDTNDIKEVVKFMTEECRSEVSPA